MKRKFACYLMLCLFVVGFLACGDSDDEQEAQPTPTTQTQPTTTQPKTGIGLPQVDIAAERAAIEELLASNEEAMKANKIGRVMSHWAKSNKAFLVHSFGGQECTERWEGVKSVIEGWFLRNRTLQIPGTIEELGIDTRGKSATIRGKLTNGTTPFTAALQKDGSKWKLLALDPIPRHKFDHCKVKWIEAPK
jgi:hypothetical protein